VNRLAGEEVIDLVGGGVAEEQRIAIDRDAAGAGESARLREERRAISLLTLTQ